MLSCCMLLWSSASLPQCAFFSRASCSRSAITPFPAWPPVLLHHHHHPPPSFPFFSYFIYVFPLFFINLSPPPPGRTSKKPACLGQAAFHSLSAHFSAWPPFEASCILLSPTHPKTPAPLPPPLSCCMLLYSRDSLLSVCLWRLASKLFAGPLSPTPSQFIRSEVHS